MGIDRTPKPCQHKRAQHEHGTRICYTLDNCRCYACAYAASVYNHDLATGRIEAFYTDAEPIRRWVRFLMDNGVGYKRISAVTGVPATSVGALLFGKRGHPISKIKIENARKLLDLTLDSAVTTRVPIRPAAGARVRGVGTTRRIQALVALGWSQASLARAIGWTPANFGPLAHGDREVTQMTADKVAALYEKLSMVRPPERTRAEKYAASRARNMARANGWLPPLAWDDDQLDDPDAIPTEVAVKDLSIDDDSVDEAAILRRMEGDKSVRLSAAEVALLMSRWKASGRPMNECQRVTGLNPQRELKKVAAAAASAEQEEGAA